MDTGGFLVCPGQSSSIYLSIHGEGGAMALAMSDMRVLQRMTPDWRRARRGRRVWWRRGESNSGPKQTPDRCLQAQLPVRSRTPHTR